MVVDDHVLFWVLAGQAPRAFAFEAESGALYSTGCWYYRLARAVAQGGGGALSGRFADLRADRQAQVRGHLENLPPFVRIVGWQAVVPVMAALRVRRPLNMISAEAAAVAVVAGADLAVHTDAPLLRAAASELGVTYRVVG